MAQDPAVQRRRAAAAVLSGVLDRPSLLQALWLAQDTLRDEQASDVIRYIDEVARRHLLDAALCKRLYTELYKALREPEGRLPPDPWAEMQTARAPAAAPRPMPAPPPAYRPAAPVAAMPAPIQRSAPAPMAPPVPVPVSVPVAVPAPAPATVAEAPRPVVATEPPVVFGAVMREVVREVFDYHREALAEVQRDCLRLLDGSRASPAAQQRLRNAWARAQQDDWQIEGSHADLAELMRVVFAALTEAFGRVGADQILRRAMDIAQALPEARQFSPKRLLAAI